MPAARASVLAAAKYLGVTAVSLPFIGLIQTLQLDGTDQSPGTPSLALLIVGGFAIIPLLIPGIMVQTLAERLRGRHTKAITVLVNTALAVAFALLAIYGRSWLGALAAIGVVLQSIFTVAVLLHEPAWPRINPTARTTTLADVIKMSERGQAREALEVLNRSVVEPENERDFLLAKTMCAYRAGAFEEAIELHQRLAETGLENAAVRAVVMADARLSAALRDSRAVTRDELDECAAAILSPDIPDEYLKIAAYAHSKALLTLASGDAETAMRAGLEILPGRSIVPADRAYVIAMVVIAAVRAGYLDIARKWNAKLPDWCPLRPAVDLALKIRSLDGARSPDDEDCVFAD